MQDNMNDVNNAKKALNELLLAFNYACDNWKIKNNDFILSVKDNNDSKKYFSKYIKKIKKYFFNFQILTLYLII